MSTIKNGGPAFPIPLLEGQSYQGHAPCDGMTLRDYFAAIHPVYWYFWVGLLLVLVVAFFRAGVVPTLARLAHRLRLRTARRTEARP